MPPPRVFVVMPSEVTEAAPAKKDRARVLAATLDDRGWFTQKLAVGGEPAGTSPDRRTAGEGA